MSSERKCLRCGHVWHVRTPYRKWMELGHEEHDPVRCASCRSKFWNKPYVRNNTNRAKGSYAYQSALPFPSHSGSSVRRKRQRRLKNGRFAGTVRRKKISGVQCNADLMRQKSASRASNNSRKSTRKLAGK